MPDFLRWIGGGLPNSQEAAASADAMYWIIMATAKDCYDQAIDDDD
jgi:hypothetical protein